MGRLRNSIAVRHKPIVIFTILQTNTHSQVSMCYWIVIVQNVVLHGTSTGMVSGGFGMEYLPSALRTEQLPRGQPNPK